MTKFEKLLSKNLEPKAVSNHLNNLRHNASLCSDKDFIACDAMFSCNECSRNEECIKARKGLYDELMQDQELDDKITFIRLLNDYCTEMHTEVVPKRESEIKTEEELNKYKEYLIKLIKFASLIDDYKDAVEDSSKWYSELEKLDLSVLMDTAIRTILEFFKVLGNSAKKVKEDYNIGRIHEMIDKLNY